ncbi:pyridoxal-phosphate dependent enzyme [Paenibacillus solisilvae]|uniref:Pyridoxal-phosphate dependent enzyme n=1 Tax=Paenibacillus solisilvae TaxID=2486751 RepID=A0ABW0VT44_9BACL
MINLTVTQKWLRCTECQGEFKLDSIYTGCPACDKEGRSGALEVCYDIGRLSSKITKSWLREWGGSIWKYADLLPVCDTSFCSTLGEGFTPLVREPYFEKEFGFGNIYLKNEASNPTWSHKDRLNAVLVSKAKELNAKGIAASSTGNHGISAAAYAALNDLPCIVFFPPETSTSYLRLAGLYGAQAFVTPWEKRGELLQKLVFEENWTPSYPFVEGGISNPYGVEGYKTIAYELIAQLDDTPDAILAPVSEGNALTGIHKGFQEMLELGVIDRIPRLYGCVPRGANALERSFERQDDKVMTLEDSYSIATSTREKTAGVHVLRLLHASKGRAVSVTDDAIIRMMQILGKRGYCVETASALPAACLEQLMEKGEIKPEEKVVCLVTSTGIKWPDLLAEMAPPPQRIEGTWESFIGAKR